jgi:hypothetical protein
MRITIFMIYGAGRPWRGMVGRGEHKGEGSIERAGGALLFPKSVFIDYKWIFASGEDARPGLRSTPGTF